ncbi:MAG: hypothetical protein H6726_06690 [Sandaracinaceae bacterium]|nr:hypothetical protein [Sandaracinaceae bacterium]
MTLSALPEWLVATRESLRDDLAALREDEALLFAQSTEALRDAPYRVYPLGERADEAPLLTGLLSLRLHVMHESLNPLVTSEHTVDSARRLAVFLFEREQREREAHRERAGHGRRRLLDVVGLRYDTLAALNPLPLALLRTDEKTPSDRMEPAAIAPQQDVADPSAVTTLVAPQDALRPGPVAALVARWEEARASETFGTYVRKKLAQNADFFRHGFSLPAYWWRRRRIRSALTNALRSNPVVMETYFAIEQVGPIIDGFVFRARGTKLGRAVGVADFAFLYMQMADELVDNLVHHLGAEGVLRLVAEYYPRSLRSSLLIPFENLDDTALEAAGIPPETPIPKYRVSFSGMLALLSDLRALLLVETQRAEADGFPGVASELQDFFHHCFGTYLDELYLPTVARGSATLDQLPLSDVQWHFFRKNNVVMMRYMALRARLTGLDPAAHALSLQRWGYLLATFQVFDDMKDVWVDFGFQPNYALQTAASLFPGEYAWLGEHLALASGGRDTPANVTRDEVTWLNARVPNTILHCIRLSRLMALFCFDYLALYAWDHRWRKNWMGRFRAFNPEGAAGSTALSWLEGARGALRTGDDAVDTCFALAHALAASGEPPASDETLAYLLDAVAYEHAGSVYRATLPSLRALYRYATLRMMLPSREKVRLLRRWLRRHAEAARAGIASLRRLDAAAAPQARALALTLEGLLERGPAPSASSEDEAISRL